MTLQMQKSCHDQPICTVIARTACNQYPALFLQSIPLQFLHGSQRCALDEHERRNAKHIHRIRVILFHFPFFYEIFQSITPYTALPMMEKADHTKVSPVFLYQNFQSEAAHFHLHLLLSHCHLKQPFHSPVAWCCHHLFFVRYSASFLPETLTSPSRSKGTSMRSL